MFEVMTTFIGNKKWVKKTLVKDNKKGDILSIEKNLLPQIYTNFYRKGNLYWLSYFIIEYSAYLKLVLPMETYLLCFFFIYVNNMQFISFPINYL